MKQKYIPVASILTGALSTVVIAVVVSAMLCNAGVLVLCCGEWFGIEGVQQYAEIFDQLRDAQIRIPILFLLILFGVFTTVIYIFLAKYCKGRRTYFICGFILLFAVVFLGALILTLLLTEVNSIRFALALKALLDFI